MKIILSLDIGTSKIALIAFDCTTQKNVMVLAEANKSTIDNLPTGFHEQDPNLIYEQCITLIKQLVSSKKIPIDTIKSIALSGQMHGVLVCDQNLTPQTNLITWCDQRAKELLSEIDKDNWPVSNTGCHLHPGYGGATLAYLAQNNQLPPNSQALTIADFVAAKLCGTVATSPSHAASWGIMDISQNCWANDLIKRLAIPIEVLPKIYNPLSTIGNLRKTVSAETSLPDHVTVSLPTGDNQASFIGTCGFNNHSLLLNLGTGGQISLPCEEIETNNSLESRPLPFGNYLLVGASLCGGRSYALLKDFFKTTISSFTGEELPDGDLFRIMDELASKANTQLNIDTRFAGMRNNTSVKGAITGIDTDNFTPEALCLGFMHGMLDELIDLLPQNLLNNIDKVLASGNAIRKSPIAQQLISAKLGIPCQLTETQEEAATGAALAVAKTQGLI